MVQVEFSENIRKHVPDGGAKVDAPTVGAALEQVFAQVPALRGYILDDQGAVRQHVTIFVNNDTIDDRVRLTDPLVENDRIYVFQALSGG